MKRETKTVLTVLALLALVFCFFQLIDRATSYAWLEQNKGKFDSSEYHKLHGELTTSLAMYGIGFAFSLAMLLLFRGFGYSNARNP